MDTQLLHGCMLEWCRKLPKHSVDMVFCDPPFGSIKEGKLKSIDQIIDPAKMWEAFRHVLKPSGTVIVFGTQPFISQVIVSNIKQFRYDLIWRKSQSGFLNANNRPMKEHQVIAVFSERAPVSNPDTHSRPHKRDHSNDGMYWGKKTGTPIYNPQFQSGKAYKASFPTVANDKRVLPRLRSREFENDGTRYYPTSVLDSPIYNPQFQSGKAYRSKRRLETSPVYANVGTKTPDIVNDGTRYFPSSVLTFKQAGSKNVHPFEKCIPLCEWLIKTYTNPGMVVLDPTMGGGTSGVAARNLGRRYIGIERDDAWFIVARDRIYSTPSMLVPEPVPLADCGD